jgi:hypothetical protein
MRWMLSVGMVRWCRIHPDLKENLSGGVGLVRWCRFGMWDEAWDFLNRNRRVRVRVGGPTEQECNLALAPRPVRFCRNRTVNRPVLRS